MRGRSAVTAERSVESTLAAGPRPQRGSSSGGPARALELQRQAGNRAVAQLLRRGGDAQDAEDRTGMPTEFRHQMESLLGHDLSAVRVHHDSPSVTAMQATALNEGTDIHLAPGQPSPDSAAGRQVLGHELAHVIQQSQGRVRGGESVGSHTVNTDLGLEIEADGLGLRAAHGERGGDSGGHWPRLPTTPGAAVTQLNGNSVPLVRFTGAVGEYSGYTWKPGTSERTIKVWNIAQSGAWDFHLSVILDSTGHNVTKFHFTLRRGPGKGTDAFAWYKITGHNANAQIGARENAGQVDLFIDPALPDPIRDAVANIDAAARGIFQKTLTYIK